MAASDDVKTIAISMNDSPLPEHREPKDVIRHLGEGGMGEVFLCVNPYHEGISDSRVPREIAVKTLSPELNQDPELLKRFEAEAKALSPIEHRNVVRLYDWGTFQSGDKAGQHYISMEYIEGVSLHRLGRARRLSFPDLLDFAVQIADGLVAVHRSNVIHRDLKPANIMITTDGVVKIIDFGIAKPTSLSGETESGDRGFKTKTGIIIGTVNYLAPELLMGASASVQSDLYAVGLIIWEALHGTTPFKADSLAETMKRVSDENLSWSEATIDIAPPGFIRLMNQLTAKDPSKRPASAEELAERLRKVQLDAKWPAIFNRRSRLDLGFSWAAETFELLRSHAVPEDDFLYVLQSIEDLMIQNRDIRIKSQKHIVVEESLLTQALEAFHSARNEAAIARQARLKAELLSGEKTRQAAGPAAPSSALGRPPVKPLTVNRSEISRQIHASNQKKAAAKPITTKRHLAWRIAIGATLIAAFSVMSFYYVQHMRHSFESTELASSGQLPAVARPNAWKERSILQAFSAWKPGTKLIYETETKSTDDIKRESQERREVLRIENARVFWKTDRDGFSPSTSITLPPLEMLFNPNLPAEDEVVAEFSDLPDPSNLERDQTFSVEIRSQSNMRERTTCRVVGELQEQHFNRMLKLVQLDCNRETFKGAIVTHRAKEHYKFATGMGVITESRIKIDALDDRGSVQSTREKESKLNEPVSTIR